MRVEEMSARHDVVEALVGDQALRDSLRDCLRGALLSLFQESVSGTCVLFVPGEGVRHMYSFVWACLGGGQSCAMHAAGQIWPGVEALVWHLFCLGGSSACHLQRGPVQL